MQGHTHQSNCRFKCMKHPASWIQLRVNLILSSFEMSINIRGAAPFSSFGLSLSSFFFFIATNV